MKVMIELTTTPDEIERVYSELFEGTMLSPEEGTRMVIEALLVDTDADVYLEGTASVVGIND